MTYFVKESGTHYALYTDYLNGVAQSVLSETDRPREFLKFEDAVLYAAEWMEKWGRRESNRGVVLDVVAKYLHGREPRVIVRIAAPHGEPSTTLKPGE